MKDSNEKIYPKDKENLIKCKNCHQEIEAKKMFLHEGFCQRNNIFCTHCNKVFLKKDYENHLTHPKKTNKIPNKTPKKKIKEKKAKIKSINIITSPIITKRDTSYEYIEMPVTEQYKINSPIIISENSQIISNKNKNEYLLPYLGINTSRSDNKDNIFNENIMTTQYNFDEKNPSMYNNNSNIELRNSNKIINNDIIYDYKNDKLNNKINIIDLSINNNYMNRIHSSNMLFNSIDFNDNKIVIKGIKNYLGSNSEPNVFKDNDKADIKSKNNNIIINKNIITYNSNNTINKINNFFSSEKNDDKDKSSMNKDIFKKINLTKFNSTRRNNNKEIINFKKIIRKNIINNSSNERNKEPNDRNLKLSPENNKKYSYILDRSPVNSNKKKENKAKTEKKTKKLQKCEFCKSEVDDLVMHYKIYHYHMKNNIIKPKKRDTALLNEKLSCTNIDEKGIEEPNKKILLRQFKSSFPVVDKFKNFQTENKFYKNEQANNTMKKIINVQKVKKKLFPEDNYSGSKTQLRDYNREKKFITKNNNFLNENKSSKNKVFQRHLNIKVDEIKFNENRKINPLYFSTEIKKSGNYDYDIIKSPAVKKIDFTKINNDNA